MTAGQWNPTIEQGATWQVGMTWADNDVPIDLSGYTARMSLRSDMSGRLAIHLSTGADGRIALGGAAGTITLALSAAETAEVPHGRYRYDLELVNSSGGVVRLLQGIITVSPEQTRDGDA